MIAHTQTVPLTMVDNGAKEALLDRSCKNATLQGKVLAKVTKGYTADTGCCDTKAHRAMERTVYGDSAVNTCVCMHQETGLHFMGLMKTAHSHFPNEYIEEYPFEHRFFYGQEVEIFAMMQK